VRLLSLFLQTEVLSTDDSPRFIVLRKSALRQNSLWLQSAQAHESTYDIFGWCVLGIIAVLNDEQGSEVVLKGELVDQGVRDYVVPDQHVLAHAVGLGSMLDDLQVWI
jgi:hypothetical protein